MSGSAHYPPFLKASNTGLLLRSSFIIQTLFITCVPSSQLRGLCSPICQGQFQLASVLAQLLIESLFAFKSVLIWSMNHMVIHLEHLKHCWAQEGWIWKSRGEMAARTDSGVRLPGLGSQPSHILAVQVGQVLNLSVPPSTYGDKTETYLTGLLARIKWNSYAEYLQQCLRHSSDSK